MAFSKLSCNFVGRQIGRMISQNISCRGRNSPIIFQGKDPFITLISALLLQKKKKKIQMEDVPTMRNERDCMCDSMYNSMGSQSPSCGPLPGCSLFGTGPHRWWASMCIRNSPRMSSSCLTLAHEVPSCEQWPHAFMCEAPFMRSSLCARGGCTCLPFIQMELRVFACVCLPSIRNYPISPLFLARPPKPERLGTTIL